MPIKVILDSNFLMIPFQFHIDIFQEIEYLLQKKVDFIVPSAVKQELTSISARGGEGSSEASLALQLASRCRVVEVSLQPEETVDDAIVKAAQKLSAVVATNDIELKKKLRDILVPVVFMRDKSKLEIEGVDREYL
ncbi:MAG: PIN domain-containing protein [Candidatus Bathyarchaeia archaeon]|nr:DNA-binding protein [Candidatus Bathyarchaeia archaeon]HKM77635.1 DNA-binding protein [Candidatus Bathyarchaeia archaeon]